MLFSIGNNGPLLSAAFPNCWGAADATNPVCDTKWLDAVSYLEIVGIICGQIFVGIVGDWIGRRWGLIQDAMIMFVGLLMLTASWGLTLSKFTPSSCRELVLTVPQTAGWHVTPYRSCSIPLVSEENTQ